MTENIDITTEGLAQLRALPDFDLTMVLSDIHDHGWLAARITLEMATHAVATARGRGFSDTSCTKRRQQ